MAVMIRNSHRIKDPIILVFMINSLPVCQVEKRLNKVVIAGTGLFIWLEK